MFSLSAEALTTFTDFSFSTDATVRQHLWALSNWQMPQTAFTGDSSWFMNTFPRKSLLIPSPVVEWTGPFLVPPWTNKPPLCRYFPPIPPHFPQSLALASWLFFFGIVFVYCSLLPVCLSIFNIFCKSASLLIRYIYSLIIFTTMFGFSSWKLISKAGPVSTRTWHINNLAWKLIVGPNLDNYLFCADNHLWPRICLLIFCKSTFLHSQYNYLLPCYIHHHVQVLEWNHISKVGQMLTIAWHSNNLTRKLIMGPSLDNLLWSTKDRSTLH